MGNSEMYKASLKDKILAIGWGFKLAWRIDKVMLMFWLSVSTLLAVLPALILVFNKNIISEISAFLATGAGEFSDVVIKIIVFGVLLTVSGLSSRINGDLLYMVMYDSYYLGLEDVMIEKNRKISAATLLDKAIKDEFFAVVRRSGSLTDLISSSCTLIAQFVSLISILIVAFPISWVIAVVATMYIVIDILLNLKRADKTRPNYVLINKDERLESHYQNLPLNPGVAKELRIYESRDEIMRQWDLSHTNVEKQEKLRLVLREKYSLVSGIGFVVFTVGTLVYSIFQVSDGRMTPDVFLLIYSLCFTISTAIKGISGNFNRFVYGLFAIERQRRFIRDVPEMKTAPAGADPIPVDNDTVIELKNVTFGYKPGTPVLKNINLKINRGETIALVGYNGSGKTTLANLIINRYQPDEGEIFLCGVPYAEYPEGGIEESIGIFFQNYYLIHASMRDNIGWGDINNFHNNDKIYEAMRGAGFDRILKKLKISEDRWVRKTVIKDGVVLSGGENQRLALARTYMSERDILIFDEPAAALDPIAEMEQFFGIRERLKGRTNILISHRIGFARLADRIIVMKDGEIAEDGTHDDLIKRNGLYAYFYNEQAQWYDKSAKEAAI